MKYRYLGNSGLKVSEISFGSYLTFGHAVDVSLARKLMQLAYDKGINLFDNAEVYAQGRSEEIMGEVLKNVKWPRDTYIVMTKVFWGGNKHSQMGLHRKHIFDACHTSLRRLNIDYIDLFLCHRPDPNTSIEETIRIMHTLIQQGKILYWGTSEWSSKQIQEAILISKVNNLTPPSLEQFQYNMLVTNNIEDKKKILTEYKLGLTTTMPLAGGLLTGKYELQGNIPHDSRIYRFKDSKFLSFIGSEEWNFTLSKIGKLSKIANAIGITLSQLALAWCLKNKLISSVIVGITNEDQLKENIKSLKYMDEISADIMLQIDTSLDKTDTIDSHDDIYNYERIKTTV